MSDAARRDGGRPDPEPPGENPLARALRAPVLAASILGGWALVALSAMIGLEVVLRKVFNASLQGADELGGYVVAVVAAFGAAHALIDRAHTRIEIFIEPLPARVRAGLNAAAMLALAAMAGFLAWRGATTLADSVAYRSLSGTPLQTPLWLPQAVWLGGLAFFAAVAVAAAAHAVALAVRNPVAANAWYGARTLREEIGEERASVARRAGADAEPAP